MSCGTLLNSCDFLEIVPPEQADLDDATATSDDTYGFLASCYKGIINPLRYGGTEASTDEFVLPPLWDTAAQRISYGMRNPNDPCDDRWTTPYKYIGQTLLFLQELPKADEVPDWQKQQWEAEAYCLLAYYHFELLRLHGPIPVTQELVDFNITPDQYPGRWHYDAVTDWIVDIIDNKVLAGDHLPAVQDINNVGRMTSVIARAIKAKALLYAASPLWNGSFPYTEWKNKNTTTVYNGKDYGYELVSHTYSAEKWERARVACQEALDEALLNGYALYTDREMYTTEQVPLANVYVPGRNNEDTDEDDKAFKEAVLMYRYMSTARFYEGNTEVVWGLMKTDDSFFTASMPNHLMKLNNGNWVNGYSGISPTRYSIEKFYMADGSMLDTSDPTLLDRANVDTERPDITKINVGREPRFYAWMVFDQGNYATMLANGSPKRVELKVSEEQGLNLDENERNHCVTGYLAQKFLRPNHNRPLTGGQGNIKQYPRPLLRMAELYLNLAECYAMQGNVDKALEYLNPVHTRGGLPAIQASDVTGTRPIMDWIRDECFLEFWGEGHRYFDLRRWAIAPQYLGAGTREGLNAEAKENPTFEEFNQWVVVPQNFTWNNNMYLMPLGYEESSKNRNLVQAPGFSQN